MSARIRSQLAYRGSFVSDVIGQVVLGLTEFIELYAIVNNIPSFGGMTFEQTLLVFALASLAFATRTSTHPNVKVRSRIGSGKSGPWRAHRRRDTRWDCPEFGTVPTATGRPLGWAHFTDGVGGLGTSVGQTRRAEGGADQIGGSAG